MTNNFPFLTIELMTSGWVRMKDGNVSASKFLRANQKHMDTVLFGGRPQGHLAIKHDRLQAFVRHANKSGVRVFWDHNKAELGV